MGRERTRAVDLLTASVRTTVVGIDARQERGERLIAHVAQ